MKNRNKKVIVAGHICIDITPVFPEGKTDNLSNTLIPGKLVHMNGVDIHTGGVVANTGLGMKLLGADVSLMGKIGNDEFGSIIMKILKEYHAEQGMIVSDTAKTSFSIVLAVAGIDRIFLHDSGANDEFYLEDLDQNLIKEAALFHFGYPPLMKSVYKNDGFELTKIMKTVHEMGVMTSLDLASVDENSESGKQNWKKILINTLPYVDFFFPSFDELAYMIAPETYQEVNDRACGKDICEVLSIENDVKPLANAAIAMGAKVIFIKCGKLGFYYKTADALSMQKLEGKFNFSIDDWSGQEGFEQSYKPSKVVSATGAGDTTIGAFLTALLDGYPFHQCLQLAAATGASCVQSYDALSGLKSFEELIQKIDAGWAKN